MNTNLQDEFYPMSASADGNKNAFHLGNCDLVGHRPPYASCLFKIGEWKAERLGPACTSCATAMARNECPAQAMRAEELLAGKAIYYIDRARLRAQNDGREEQAQVRLNDLLISGGVSLRKANLSPKAPLKSVTVTVKSADFMDAQQGSYADAINLAVQEQPVAAAVAPPPPVVHVIQAVRAGMSMVEIARAAMARASV